MIRPAAMFLAMLITLGALPAQNLKERFEALDAKGDRAGIVALWKENPSRILSIIDSYLEGGLKILEGDAPDRKKVDAMYARAIRGALAADEATGRSIFSDYASSFAGWNAEQQKQFRAGQKAFGAHRTALREGKVAEALRLARECEKHARPLGDWWGTAMGLSGIGNCLERMGQPEQALTAHQDARLIYQNLGLRSELGNLTAMARLLVELDRKPRARVTIEKALVLARRSRRGANTVKELEALLAKIK